MYTFGGTPPALPDTWPFNESPAALRQLPDLLGSAGSFAVCADYTFGMRCEATDDAQLDLLEAQFGVAPAEDADQEDDAPAMLPTPGLSLVEQLHMDEPLMRVIANKHKRGYYRCTHCPQTFSNIFDYAAHMDEFDIKREFKCPFALCPWKILGLPRRPDLRRHCAIQHKHELPAELKEFLNLSDETYPALKCPHQYCDKVFHRRDAYNRHVSIVHEKLGSRFNKRLFQILAECPYDRESERQTFVRSRMRSRKTHCNTKKTR